MRQAMRRNGKRLGSLVLGALLALVAGRGMAAGAHVTESARDLPVAANADVVVVGGGSGAVSAACAAAKAGAKVFLMAPRNYLGEDLAGTMRLWLEPGETPDSPLARKLFAEEGLVTAGNALRSLKFTYQADAPSGGKHRDTKTPSLLCDGKADSAQYASVQYDGDVTITADLGAAKRVRAAQIVLYQRAADYKAKSVSVATSADGRQWKSLGTQACADGATVTVTVPVGAETRKVRFHVTRDEKSQRLLIGEIALTPDAPEPAPTPSQGIRGPWRPMHIKKTLDAALLAAGVQFLYGCMPTDVLRDAQGKVCGVVMANRAGRQAVLARTIIDASEHAVVARLAGAEFAPAPAGPVTVKWITIGERARSAPGLSVRRLELPVRVFDKKGMKMIGKPAVWLEHTAQLEPKGEGWAARAELEQKIRDLASDPGQFFSADMPYVSPTVSIKAMQHAGADVAIETLDLGVYQPKGVERVWVLSGCADVARETAEKLLRPVAYIGAGARVGRAAAEQAKAIAAPQQARVARQGAPGAAAEAGEVKEALAGLRPSPAPARIPQEQGPLPVLGRYDVVVIGGGTAGAPAGIAAARKGARTLVVEFLSGLGGVGTLGMIDTYWYGNRTGFTNTVASDPLEARMEWYRHELRKAGADIWFESMGCGAVMNENRVAGVVVVTPMGRGVVLAKSVVDATGNADIAIAGGAAYDFVGDDFALQNAHVPPREVGAWYMNGNVPAIADADPLNVRQALLDKGRGAPQAFDWGQIIDSRERRRIVGDYTLDWLDVINERTFPDSIVRGQSDYDSHGYQIHPYFMLRPARIPGEYKHQFKGYVPYRCLLPKGVEGVLVAGLGMSVHRDALPIVRMQPDLHNQGYAAGYAAAMAAQAGITPRQIDVKALQKHLVEIGNLAPSALTDRDSYPLPPALISAALTSVTKEFVGVEVLMAQPAEALPALRQAHAQAEGAAKVAYAEVLGAMGDVAGLPTLLAEAERVLKVKDAIEAGMDPKESGNLGGMDNGTQPKISMTTPDQLSRLCWALGGPRDRHAVPMLCTIAGEAGERDLKLTRAAVVSLGRIGSPAAAPTLAGILKQSSGKEPGIRELITAVALYRCGDRDGLARRTLEQFLTQPNGTWAELAAQTLRSKPGQPAKD